MYISTFVFWLSNLSMLRQGLAIPIVSLSLYYLIFKENFKKFYLFSFFSASIHYSSLFAELLIFILYFLLRNLNIKDLRILVVLLSLLIIYPHNIFSDFILYIVSSIYIIYESPITDKLLWYFQWDKLNLWHIKHVYYLILMLFIFSGLLEKDKKRLIIILIPMSFLALFKYDEMVTDRIFMYFVPFIPYIIYSFLFENFITKKITINYTLIKSILIFIIILGTLAWFNIKVLILQYSGWFIYPYMNVR